MSKVPLDQNERLEKQYRRLRTRDPMCLGCGESDPFCLELHHLAGQKNHDDVSIVCRNCHRKLSNKQSDHAIWVGSESEGGHAPVGHYLLGLADALTIIVKALRSFGKRLMGVSHDAG